MERETLHRFFEGDATSEEKKAVKQWLDASEEHYAELFKEREFFDALILSDKKHIEKFRLTPKRNNLVRTILFETGKIAAVITLMFFVGNYFYTQKANQYQIATNTITVPAGQRAHLQLSDGTDVWLNARTKITYPSLFTGSTREIRLDGEAYFEVKHNPEQPFIVHTKKYDIKALGTSFNVDAYSDSKDFSTALMEGSVMVTDPELPRMKTQLYPNYKVENINDILVTGKIDDYDIYRWREGLICFKEMNFMELMKKFEKCYGITIIVENREMADKVFGGKFRISDGIDSALRVLQRKSKFSFERNNEDTIVYIR